MQLVNISLFTTYSSNSSFFLYYFSNINLSVGHCFYFSIPPPTPHPHSSFPPFSIVFSVVFIFVFLFFPMAFSKGN